MRRSLSLFAIALPLFLSGCSLLPSTRKLPLPKAPSVVQTVTPEQLVAQLNKNWDSLNTLTAKVDILASITKAKEGSVTTEPSFPANILLSKPDKLRVYAQVPVLRTEMFDMASDGKDFTLYVPSRKKAVEGPNTLTKRSPNEFENMRPAFFYDAMVVRGLAPDELYSVTADSETIEDPQKKHLLTKSEYVLSIMRTLPDSRQLKPVRVVTFDRSDLKPYQQDIYDGQGNIETQVIYGQYAEYGDNKYSSKVTIKRPADGIQVVLTVLSVVENQKLGDEQFTVKLPPDTQVEKLH